MTYYRTFHIGIGIAYFYDEHYHQIFSEEQINTFLKKSFNPEYFNTSQKDGEVTYALKQSILEENLAPFLEKIFSTFEHDDKSRKTLLKNLEGKTYADYLIMSRNQHHQNFQKNAFTDVSKKYGRRFLLEGEMICFMHQSNVFFECYYNTFKYLENLHKQIPIDNPLKNLVRVTF